MGLIISAIVIGGGLLWILYLSIKGRDVDRRVVYLFVGATVALAIIFRLEFGEVATPIVKSVFDKIENLPAGSKIVLSYDFDPAMAPEVNPMANAFIRHILEKKHRLYFMSLWATGQSLLSVSLNEVLTPEFPDAKYGVDYCNLGYKAGNEGVLNVVITNFRKMFPSDANGNSLDSLPMFKDVESLKDMDLLISVGGGKPGVKEWILFAGDPGKIAMAGGSAAVSAPLLYPYWPRQLIGLLGGTKGAAEYEAELIKTHPRFKDMNMPALRMMGPQTMAHVVIIAFIVIGNIAYFRSRKKGGQP
jgi:hypothetical protein